MTFTCGICGHEVYRDDDHVAVEVDWEWIDDRSERDDYLLHTDCARASFEGWRVPA